MPRLPSSASSLPKEREGERLLTTGEVATLFRVDQKTVNRWAAAGKLRHRRTPGGHLRFFESDIRRLLDDGEVPGPADPS